MIDGRRVELIYPTKLSDAEHEDIAAQVYPLPQEIAQQMLDAVQAKIQAGHVKTNPAALLRGIVRKYLADPESFDPSIGFPITEARRRRAAAEKRLQAALEARARIPATFPLPPPENRPKSRPEGLKALLKAVSPVLARAE